jgi:hypothetical protein
MRAAMKNLGVNFGYNETTLLSTKRHETTFQGNQYVSSKSWINSAIARGKSGGGGQI